MGGGRRGEGGREEGYRGREKSLSYSSLAHRARHFPLSLLYNSL